MISPISSSKSILLIDDDEDDCFLFSRAIMDVSPDFEVKCTYSTEDLLTLLERTKPAIIFIDLHLLKHNGFECLRLIRSYPDFKDIPVVFWSGSCDVNDRISAYREGAQYYFEKPYLIRDLVAELKKILSNFHQTLTFVSLSQEMVSS
ncbi:response regulator [Chitinophagaceae bacterium LB-8]|uniref:Response regulator n=1 Tax=Paraflavisolibacter caeni TaxID=2982496 RepID=A0A9X3BK68_9BACT|nr:response regulator [Paraflavisolibacter caeni]MCU7552323.1 response regulator [Paraflavisolibacter caeni]